MALVTIGQLIRRYDDHGLVHLTPSRPVYHPGETTWHRTSGSGVALCTKVRQPNQPIFIKGAEVPFHVKHGTNYDVLTTCLWCLVIEMTFEAWDTDG